MTDYLFTLWPVSPLMRVLHLEKVAQENVLPILADLTSPWALEDIHSALAQVRAVIDQGIALHFFLVEPVRSLIHPALPRSLP